MRKGEAERKGSMLEDLRWLAKKIAEGMGRKGLIRVAATGRRDMARAAALLTTGAVMAEVTGRKDGGYDVALRGAHADHWLRLLDPYLDRARTARDKKASS
ncbi:MAG: hypothetical protein BWY99_02138 [Synergistetes bacterium ADurb.BinA166]|nr:MAG: hypothetical protein BWY99_02138 [Synergistetes bacterium ADurb.BinA166]